MKGVWVDVMGEVVEAVEGGEGGWGVEEVGVSDRCASGEAAGASEVAGF